MYLNVYKGERKMIGKKADIGGAIVIMIAEDQQKDKYKQPHI